MVEPWEGCLFSIHFQTTWLTMGGASMSKRSCLRLAVLYYTLSAVAVWEYWIIAAQEDIDDGPAFLTPSLPPVCAVEPCEQLTY